MLRIGELSDRTGVPCKTIRYYEEIGLLPPARRAQNSYRVYDDEDVERLRFIRGASVLGFTLDEIAEVLAFRDRGEPPCSYVMTLLRERVDKIEDEIRTLEWLHAELEALREAG